MFFLYSDELLSGNLETAEILESCYLLDTFSRS